MLTSEQLHLRQAGVSGSEAAALVGLSRWASPIDIYQAKIDPIATQRLADMESPLIRGILFEEPVIKWYALITGRTVSFPGTLQHKRYPRIFATPDGVATLPDGDTRALEVKNSTFHSRDHWGDPGTDDIDECYLPQVLFEMAVTGLPQLDLCLYMGVEPMIYHVDFDEDTFEALREVCERFYTDHVLTRTPPPPDASESYARYVEKIFPCHHGPMVQADEEAARWMADLLAVREELKEVEGRETLIKTQLKLRIGDACGIEHGDLAMTWLKTKDSTKYDFKQMVKELGIEADVLEKYKYIQKGHRRFLVK